MDTQRMAQALVAKGYTQERIAEMIQMRGVFCHKSTVHRMLKGSEPTYSVGSALQKVYMDHCEPRRDEGV